MMKCAGCYKEVKEGYCLSCRKKLFHKTKIGSTLAFDAPKTGNLEAYQKFSKRLSISGVQLKYSLVLEGTVLNITDHKGQYILKPIPPTQLEHAEALPENEHLTMQIAEQVFNIKTAANALIYFKDGQPAYITRRFDVKGDGEKYLQEDFAQLTNRTKATRGESFKYDGTYEEIGQLIKKYVAAAMPALENFFKLIVFNYVVSNGDAHLKNFSLIRSSDSEYEMSPAYDLVSTVIHTPQESDTALDLYNGDEQEEYYVQYGHYGRQSFLELSNRLGLVTKRAEKIIDEFFSKKEMMYKMIQQSFLDKSIKDLYFKNIAEKLKRLRAINN